MSDVLRQLDRDKLIETIWAGGGRRRTADVEQTVRTPHSDVGGKNIFLFFFSLLGNAKKTLLI